MRPLSANAERVLEARYLRRGATRAVCETPEELFRRVARGVAHAELLLGTAAQAARWETAFFEVLAEQDFLPNSPTLMNAGTPLGQLAACFVLPVEDSIDSIFGALRAMALLQRAGGGTGFSFSRLRPSGDVVASTGGEASGPVSFMRVFDAATENVRLGGRRRGANMGVLRVDHPDIVTFIDAKTDDRSLRNFNLSVAVTDRFLEAVVGDGMFELVHPRRRSAVASLHARTIFDRIVDRAWQTGDPGLLYIDAINRANPTPALGDIESTNPCGEVPLLPWESCVLGSINLAHMVREIDGAPAVDWERLQRTVRIGVQFLDDAIEVNREALPEIADATRSNRKIGLGVMGFAEMLILLGVRYGTPASIAWADRVMACIAREAHATSQRLAEERGPFPNWDRSTWAAAGERMRNAALLSIAPTGTIGIIAATSGGIEPLYALAYRRHHSLGGAPLLEINPVLLRHLAAHGLDGARIVEEIAATGTLSGVDDVPDTLRHVFVTATELSVREHLEIQRAFQRHVDNAVSKTINLPEGAGRDDVADAFLAGWRLGLKGVTVYRSGSSAGQVLELGLGEEATATEFFAKCDPDACRL